MKKSLVFVRRVLAYHFLIMLTLFTLWFVGYCFVHFDYPHFATWSQDSRRGFVFGYSLAAFASLGFSGLIVSDQQVEEKYYKH